MTKTFKDYLKEAETSESGLQYYTGVKKHGKEYMKKAAQAGRDGASQEELGRLKDKYSKAEKTKEDIAIDENQVPASDNVLKLVVTDYKKLKAEQDLMAKQGYDEDVEMIERRLKDLRQMAELIKDGGYLAGVDTAVADDIVDYYKKAGEPLPFARESQNVEEFELDRIKELAGASIDETYDDDDAFYEAYGEMWWNDDDDPIDEAEYQGRKVKLGKPMQGDVKKFKVYVKDPKTGNIKKVNFGHGGSSVKGKAMSIKKNNPKRRKSFRARHNCDNPGPRTKARYWSCRKW